MMLMTPPRDEPQVDEAGPLITSILSIMPTGIEFVSAAPLLRKFQRIPSRRTSMCLSSDPWAYIREVAPKSWLKLMNRPGILFKTSATVWLFVASMSSAVITVIFSATWEMCFGCLVAETTRSLSL